MTKKFNEIIEVNEFKKDKKKLLKRFPSLEDDLNVFINAQLVAYHKHGIDNGSIFPIPGLEIDFPKVFKAKKFACKSLPGKGVKSGIRIIYSLYEEEDRIELIEIYYKGDQKDATRERILKLYRNAVLNSQEKPGTKLKN